MTWVTALRVSQPKDNFTTGIALSKDQEEGAGPADYLSLSVAALVFAGDVI